MLDEALTAPGNLHGVYDRFYSYSFFNQLLLRMQGLREPVATYKKWAELGRQVLKGSKAKEIIRPIFSRPKDEREEPVLIGFTPVRCIFGYSETEGEELPPVQLPEWDADIALAKLKVRRVPFTELNGNIQGASRGKEISINPVAANPAKTLIHELGHVVLGHTLPESITEYSTHRGIQEFQAEATAYLTMKELDSLDEITADRSRAYVQGWMANEPPPDAAIRQVFGAVDVILKAGRVAVVDAVK